MNLEESKAINNAMKQYVERYKTSLQTIYSDLQTNLARSFQETSSGQKRQVATIPVKKSKITYDFDKKLDEVANRLDQYKEHDPVDFSKEIQKKASLVDAEAKRFDNLKEGNNAK